MVDNNVFDSIPQRDKTKRSRTRLAVWILALLTLVCVAAAFVFDQGILPKIRYNSALRAAQSGDYEEAERLFSLAGDYLDSLEKLAAVELAAVPVGGTLFYGSYEQDNDLSNGPEPIEWIVLTREGCRILLFCTDFLDFQPYCNGDTEAATWADSALREWLNSVFLKTAFTPAEAARIPTVHLSNPDNPDYFTAGGPDTADRIFVLSPEEAFAYRDLILPAQWPQLNPYLLAKLRHMGLAGPYGAGSVWPPVVWARRWWLRSPGETEELVAYVNYESFNAYGTDPTARDIAVCPVFWLDYSDLFTEG